MCIKIIIGCLWQQHIHTYIYIWSNLMFINKWMNEWCIHTVAYHIAGEKSLQLHASVWIYLKNITLSTSESQLWERIHNNVYGKPQDLQSEIQCLKDTMFEVKLKKTKGMVVAKFRTENEYGTSVGSQRGQVPIITLS